MLDARFESKTSSFAYRICLPCQSFPSCHITRTRSILFCCWFKYLMGLVFEDYGSPNCSWLPLFQLLATAGSTLYPPPKLAANAPENGPKRPKKETRTYFQPSIFWGDMLVSGRVFLQSTPILSAENGGGERSSTRFLIGQAGITIPKENIWLPGSQSNHHLFLVRLVGLNEFHHAS